MQRIYILEDLKLLLLSPPLHGVCFLTFIHTWPQFPPPDLVVQL